MSTLTAETTTYGSPLRLKERLQARFASIRALGKNALKRTVTSDISEETLAAPQAETSAEVATSQPFSWLPTATEKIEAAQRSGHWQRVGQVQFQMNPLEAPVPTAITTQESTPIYDEQKAEPAYVPKHLTDHGVAITLARNRRAVESA